MSKKTKSGKPQPAPDTKAQAKKPKKDAASKSAGTPAEKPAFDFVGRVAQMEVSIEGADSFAFELQGRGGKRQAFRLNGEDPFILTAMAQIIMFAHALETKIGVRTVPGEDGLPRVVHLETGAGLGKKA